MQAEVHVVPVSAVKVQRSDLHPSQLTHSQYIVAENVAEKEAAFDRVSRAGNARALVKNIAAFCDCV
ncbi:hypothetical protein LG201_01985 [Methylobacillus gramineus]|uniref:hypothetical protein n=1 Tax=Methylobacillus gramineus TaxID=755169 RepID=UPI001D00110E|nr:hypothetical protein [Methylobacillus gramineus]MCB5183972.1 hypothetical protein [Methylobacillus gramineus]